MENCKTTFDVRIKFDDLCFTVEANAYWTVEHLKSKLAEYLNHDRLKSSDIDVIFCGHRLGDELKLQDCQLQDTSTVFATRRKVSTRDVHVSGTLNHAAEGGFSSLDNRIIDVESQDKDADVSQRNEEHSTVEKHLCATNNAKPKIYVYCKNPCHSVQTGKLRVCCRACKRGMFVVQQDPSSWDDVLTPAKIRGTCQSETCSGEIAEFYFKCANHPTIDADRAVALDLIKTNTRDVVCLSCEDIRDPVLVFPCASRHTLCLECFAMYCQLRLDERGFTADEDFGYTLPCPDGCPDSLIKETHHFRILGDGQYSRYQRFGAEEWLLKDGGVLCPAPGCGAGLVPDPGSRRVECEQRADYGCGFVFCRECCNAYHQGKCGATEAQPEQNAVGETYAVDHMRAPLAQWELNKSRETIRKTTKPCTKCQVPTERNGGCMHMVCAIQQCKFEWCWVCSIEWNRNCMADHWFDVNG